MSLIEGLIDALRCLPGVGPKSAQRMAYHFLERDREGALRVAGAIQQAVERVGHCEQCRTLSETTVCALCENPKRDESLLCIVESPMDVLALE
ncbi:MAG: recombination protein RecR, partial [Gammaproteobacteria bacterium]|nr:recombination protein RecR [Gammaproteobacteria bacterium]